MVKFQSSTLKLDYPVYGSVFLGKHTLLVTGGGGEGNNGIPNKLSVVDINFDLEKSPLSISEEVKLADQEDAPTCIDSSNDGTIIFSCNKGSKTIENGENDHLRRYKFNTNNDEKNSLIFEKSAQISKATDPQEYIKNCCISTKGDFVALSTSNDNKIFVVNTNDLTEIFQLIAENAIKDISISPDDEIIAYSTPSTVKFVSSESGKFLKDAGEIFKNYTINKIKFIDNDIILIAAALKNGNSGIALIKYSISQEKILLEKTINKKIKAVTSLAYDKSKKLIGLAGSDTSIILVNAIDFSVITTLSNVHSFAVTSIQFSPDCKYLSSGSADNSINVFVLPADIKKGSDISSMIILTLIMLLAVVIQYILMSNFGKK